MPIDSSIYFQQQSPDVLGNVQQGMKMRDMIDQRNKQKAIDEAYRTGAGDPKQTMTALLNAGAGKEAMEMQNQSNQQDKFNREKQAYEIDMVSRVAPTIKDQGTYVSAIDHLNKLGIDTSMMPKAYDPGLVNQYTSMALSQKEKLDQQFRQQQLASAAADRKEARDERRFQAGIKMDEKMQALKTPYGLANSEDDAKKLKEAHEAKMNFDNKIEQMIALRRKHHGGATLNREDVERGKQLSKDLLLEYKNMAKLGVLSKSDEDIINSIIPEDPLAYNSPLAAIQGQDPILNRLQSFKSDSDKDFNTRVQTRTRAGINTAATPNTPTSSNSAYHTMSDDELLAEYNRRIKGATNANSR